MKRWRMDPAKSSTDWEKDIVETEWTDKDTDIMVQYEIDTKFLGLKDVQELD